MIKQIDIEWIDKYCETFKNINHYCYVDNIIKITYENGDVTRIPLYNIRKIDVIHVKET